MRIYLIGFMGSGKSYTGKRLAHLCSFPFVDLDAYIEEKAGMPIPQIFEADGEDGFRIREQQALHETLEWPNAIISTGGGAPCFFDNMEWMKQHGLVVYLEASSQVLSHRLGSEMQHRPLLQGQTPETLVGFIEERIAQRRAWYEQAHVSHTQDAPTATPAHDIYAYLQSLKIVD